MRPRRVSRSASRPGLAGDDSGATAIEFALVLGPIIMLVLGTLQIGRALMAQNDMSHAVSEAVRTVHLDPATPAAALVAGLEARLADVAGTALAVAVTEIAGTSYMRIDVEFPFMVRIPFLPDREVRMRVETLAPMVSAIPAG